jgi:propanediol dehydratase small subunit
MDQSHDRLATVTRYDYPLSTERPELLYTKHGTRFTDVTLGRLRKDELCDADLRIGPDSLRLQAQIARDVGRPQLAENLCRAAELAQFDDKVIIEIYNAMRPSAASRDKMKRDAKKLEDHGAPLCAQLVREAAEVYEQRKLFTNQDATEAVSGGQ